VVDDLAAGDRLIHGFRLRDAAADQLDAALRLGQVRGLAGAEIVENTHRIASGQ